jgi:hypothetical protein
MSSMQFKAENQTLVFVSYHLWLNYVLSAIALTDAVIQNQGVGSVNFSKLPMSNEGKWKLLRIARTVCNFSQEFEEADGMYGTGFYCDRSKEFVPWAIAIIGDPLTANRYPNLEFSTAQGSSYYSEPYAGLPLHCILRGGPHRLDLRNIPDLLKRAGISYE